MSPTDAAEPFATSRMSALTVRRSSDRTGMDRIEFSSDAVFAIAMTLLVVTLVIRAAVTAAGRTKNA